MPLPALLAAALPYAIQAGGSALGSWLGSGSSSNQRRTPQGIDGSNVERISRFSPEQSSALNKLLSQGLQGMGQLQQPSFDPIEQRARSQFEQRTIPTIAERFTSMGGQASSAFPELLGQAGAGLEEDLAAQRALFGQQQYGQQFQNLMSLLNLGLTPQFDTLYRPEQPSFLQSLLPGLAGGLGQSLPSIIQLLSQFGSSAPNPKPNEPAPKETPGQANAQNPLELFAADMIKRRRSA